MKYDKPPKTYQEQIALLKERGVIFDDEKKAEHQLAAISYYRLSAYMFPFKKNVGGHIVDEFRYGTTWKDIYNLYVFDRKLRLLVFDAIEKIEIAVRCQIVYQLSHRYGSHWQDNPDIFKEPQNRVLSDGTTQAIDVFHEIQNHIAEQLHNNKAEIFIKHYVQTYDEPVNPPFMDVCGGNVFQSSITDMQLSEESFRCCGYSLIFPFTAQNFQFVAAHNKLCPQHLRTSRSSLEQGFQHCS